MAFDIDQEHPEYVARKAAWRKYRDLYAGGEQFKANAAEYLIRRQREPGEVYSERLSRVFYENYVGSIVDWYAATLFRREPVITFEGQRRRVEDVLRGAGGGFGPARTSLADFFRRQFTESLVTGTSYVLVDFPRVKTRPGTRGEEDASGASRAYLVEYARGRRHQLEPGRARELRVGGDPDEADQERPRGGSEWRTETRWAYYDKRTYRIYGEDGLTDEGTHGLAKLGQTPLFALRIPEGLWMLNRAGSLQLEHFNKSNALSWALTMGLFAMPVVYSDREWSQMVGESYYIQLGPEDKFGWTEPEGKVYQIAADNLVRLREEIYRVCYLSQAGAALDVTGRQSALSKQRDFSITQEVLRGYGDAIKEQIRRVLRATAAAREDGLDVSVTGMDEFDIADFGTELEDARQLLALGVASPTLKKEVFKKLALKYLCDSRQDVKDRIAEEIEGT